MTGLNYLQATIKTRHRINFHSVKPQAASASPRISALVEKPPQTSKDLEQARKATLYPLLLPRPTPPQPPGNSRREGGDATGAGGAQPAPREVRPATFPPGNPQHPAVTSGPRPPPQPRRLPGTQLSRRRLPSARWRPRACALRRAPRPWRMLRGRAGRGVFPPLRMPEPLRAGEPRGAPAECGPAGRREEHARGRNATHSMAVRPCRAPRGRQAGVAVNVTAMSRRRAVAAGRGGGGRGELGAAAAVRAARGLG